MQKSNIQNKDTFRKLKNFSKVVELCPPEAKEQQKRTTCSAILLPTTTTADYYFLSKIQESEALNDIVDARQFLGGKFYKTTSKFKTTKKILMLHVQPFTLIIVYKI